MVYQTPNYSENKGAHFPVSSAHLIAHAQLLSIVVNGR